MRRAKRIKWSRDEGDVLPAWVADMDFPVSPAIQAVVSEFVERSDLGYHRLPIPRRLRAAFVERMSTHFDWHIEGGTWPLVNVVQGLDAAILLHSEKGDGAVLQTPIYAPFQHAVDGTGRERIDCPLVRSAEGWEIDFDHLAHRLETARCTPRIFMLCNPHNPTGRVLTRVELEGIAELAAKHDLVVISDEIWQDLLFDGRRHQVFANLAPEVQERTITLTSPSKGFNTAGLPFAMAVFGSERLRAPFRTMAPHLMGHGGILGTEATIAAWTASDDWLAAVVSYLEGNRRFIGEFLAAHLPGVDWRSPDATYVAWLDLNAYGLGENPAEWLLENARIALSPGPDFGPPGAGCARLNFATSRGILGQILERMAEALSGIG